MATGSHRLPPLDKILDDASPEINQSEAREQIGIIEKTLADFGLPVQVRNVHHGPRLTQFGLKPKSEVKVSNITQLAQDLAVALSGRLADIQEPSPTYPFVRLAVENFRRPDVKLRRVIDTAAFRKKAGAIKIGLGLDIFGQPVIIDLAALPHLLIGGTTGSGKSVCVNAITASLLCSYPPEALKLLLIDPIQVELKKFNGLPHLIMPLISDSAQVLQLLGEIARGIDQRYRQLAELKARDIAGYNQKAARAGHKQLPYMVIIIDNLFDLMMNAPKELETVLTRMAQKARGAGVHLILSTVRPHTDTLSGSIKANFPGRIAFRVTNKAESQLILDSGGAEELLGQGDMLYKAPDTPNPRRVQGVHISEAELDRLIGFWRQRGR